MAEPQERSPDTMMDRVLNGKMQTPNSKKKVASEDEEFPTVQEYDQLSLAPQGVTPNARKESQRQPPSLDIVPSENTADCLSELREKGVSSFKTEFLGAELHLEDRRGKWILAPGIDKSKKNEEITTASPQTLPYESLSLRNEAGERHKLNPVAGGKTRDPEESEWLCSPTKQDLAVQPVNVDYETEEEEEQGNQEEEDKDGEHYDSSHENLGTDEDDGHTQTELPPPTDEEIEEYARYLGMDVEQDAHLLWIAEQAMRAPLPDGWKEETDHIGRTYFFNTMDSTAHWDHPYDHDYRFLFEQLKVNLQLGYVTRSEVREMAEYFGIEMESEQSLLWIVEQAILAPLPPGWEEGEDDEGPYFFEMESDEAQRQHPMDDTFFELVETERKKLQQRQALTNDEANASHKVEHMWMTLEDEEQPGIVYEYDWVTHAQSQPYPAAQPLSFDKDNEEDEEEVEGIDPRNVKLEGKGNGTTKSRLSPGGGKAKRKTVSEDCGGCDVDDGKEQSAGVAIASKESWLIWLLRLLHAFLSRLQGKLT